jgi:predicted HTH domain antitoxin
MRLSIELPDIKPLSDMNDKYLKEMLIATLYNLGKISAKEAAKILSKTRREFEELLPQFGLSILNDSQENIEIELNAKNSWYRYCRSNNTSIFN